MESAITSRLISEAFIPSVPMVTPSLMEMVLISIGVPPAARTPFFDLGRQATLVEVTGHGLDPGVSDTNERAEPNPRQ